MNKMQSKSGQITFGMEPSGMSDIAGRCLTIGYFTRTLLTYDAG